MIIIVILSTIGLFIAVTIPLAMSMQKHTEDVKKAASEIVKAGKITNVPRTDRIIKMLSASRDQEGKYLLEKLLDLKNKPNPTV